MDVVRRELVVPAQPAGVDVERDHRIAVEVVALAALAVVIRSGIAGAEVGEVQLGIVRRGDPDARSAARPRITRPRVVARLARPRNREEPPGALAGIRVVGVDEAAASVLAAGRADDHLVLDDQRRDRRGIALLEVLHHHVPHDVAGLHVEGEEVRVERGHEQLVAENAEAAVD